MIRSSSSSQNKPSTFLEPAGQRWLLTWCTVASADGNGFLDICSTKRRYLLRVDYCKPGLISVAVFAVFGQKVRGERQADLVGLVVVVVVLGG